MPAIQRWIFHDPDTDETWTVPINPNSMTDPENRTRDFQFGVRSRSANIPAPAAIRGIENPLPIIEWEFGGVIHTQVHHDTLEYWSRKPGEIEITDHFGRTWVVLMKTFEPTERRPTPSKPWRFSYEMHADVLERVA